MTEVQTSEVDAKPATVSLGLRTVKFGNHGKYTNVLTVEAMFRAVFWVVLPCKMIVGNHFTRQYNPEDSSEHHTRRRENLKSHTVEAILVQQWIP
jgi:hypothetical protein